MSDDSVFSVPDEARLLLDALETSGFGTKCGCRGRFVCAPCKVVRHVLVEAIESERARVFGLAEQFKANKAARIARRRNKRRVVLRFGSVGAR